ncbi:MAG: anti-sigma factor family protein [Armatimonadota bacterium]
MWGRKGGGMQDRPEECSGICEHIEGLLCAYVDAEATEDERALVERHIVSCAHCRRELAMLREAVVLASALEDAEVPEGLHERIMSATIRKTTVSARLKAIVRNLRPAPVLRVGVALGAAALLLGAITAKGPHQQVAHRATSPQHRATTAKSTDHAAPKALHRKIVPATVGTTKPLVAALLAAPVRPRPTPAAAPVPAKRDKVYVAGVRPVSPASTVSAPSLASEPADRSVDEAESHPVEIGESEIASIGAVEPEASPSSQAQTARTITLDASRRPDTTGSEAASALPSKLPVLVASVPTARPQAETKEWQARQLMELSRRLAEEAVHGERRQLSVDLVRMRF